MTSFKYRILSDNPNISVFAVNKHIKENLTFITESSNIHFKQQINAGKFGFVFNAETPECKDAAVKIVSEDDIGEHELAWQSFANKYVVPLLDTHSYPKINTRVFIMPRAANTLDVTIRDEYFKNRMDCLDIVSSWIDNIVNGDQYLHAQGYAHCCLKTKNILIMDDNRAVICHFHSLAPVNRFVNCDEVAKMFRPPECFRNGIDRRPLAGCLDIYSIGILVIEVYTGDLLGLKLPATVTCWSKDVYPVLFKLLSKFPKICKEQYPNVKKWNLKSTRNFVCACLRIDPEKRAKTTHLWKHQFVGGVELYPEDRIWQYKANKNKLRKRVKNLKVFQEVDQPTIICNSVSFESNENSKKDKSQKAVNKEESLSKDIVSNLDFSPELNNTIAGKSSYENDSMSLKQESAYMQGEPGECFEKKSAPSLLLDQIKNRSCAHSHCEKRDISNMKDNINHESDETKVYEGKEKVQCEVERFIPSEERDLYDIRKHKNIAWNKKNYVEREDQELSETNFMSKEEEFERDILEKVFDNCKNFTFRQLMNYTFRDSFAYRITHPDNFLNKLSARLTHKGKKSHEIKNNEKYLLSERILDADSGQVEMETAIFPDSLKELPVKMIDILLTYLL